jgi:hypothetical protein
MVIDFLSVFFVVNQELAARTGMRPSVLSRLMFFCTFYGIYRRTTVHTFQRKTSSLLVAVCCIDPIHNILIREQGHP